MKRVFAAIDIPSDAKHKVNVYIEELRREFEQLRVGWERPEKLHFTLKFAGSLDKRRLADLMLAVRDTAHSSSPFEAALTGNGAFLSRRGSNVLWIGVSGDQLENFGKLAAGIEQRFEPGGRVLKTFKPHLTIARLREPQRSQELIDKHLDGSFGPVSFEVRELVVYESRLLPTGSVYTKLGTFPLNG